MKNPFLSKAGGSAYIKGMVGAKCPVGMTPSVSMPYQNLVIKTKALTCIGSGRGQAPSAHFLTDI
jgi:phosphoribosylcarboxyaminoimidazole (NCAIR) mutase